ncbi:Rpn family recombination-promoting nuclease/putative transposase [Treponema sp.]|uniref:Rpn family recombination-promoting nuclease/putative transposase n=1 Tax=Treponema sp. TaxID=166 RepID=UPI00388FF28C
MNSKEKMTPDEKWDNATLANNFIFYKVMRNHPEACKHLIELLLKIRVNSMEIHGEEVIDIDHDAKGIRLDVFVKENNRMYDIEVQVVNTKELPERARYYQGLMDLDSLKSGQKYRELPDSHIIFLCLEDIFKNGLPVSTFENICLEDLKTKLNDRAYKHFFIRAEALQKPTAIPLKNNKQHNVAC